MTDRTLREHLTDLIKSELDAALTEALSSFSATKEGIPFTENQIRQIGEIAETRIATAITNKPKRAYNRTAPITPADPNAPRRGRRAGAALSNSPSAVNQRMYREARKAREAELVKTGSNTTSVIKETPIAYIDTRQVEQDRLWAEYDSQPFPQTDNIGETIATTTAEALNPTKPVSNLNDDPLEGLNI